MEEEQTRKLAKEGVTSPPVKSNEIHEVHNAELCVRLSCHSKFQRNDKRDIKIRINPLKSQKTGMDAISQYKILRNFWKRYNRQDQI